VWTWWGSVLVLLVTGPACQSNSAKPSLVRIEPSVLAQTELPRAATILGENLRMGMRLSLDDENAAQLAAPKVTFNGVNAAWVSYRGANQLDVMLPVDLAPGSYDVEVTLDALTTLQLQSGLLVLGAAATSSDGSDETNTHGNSGAQSTAASGAESSASVGVDLVPSSDSSNSSSEPPSPFRCEPGEFGPPELVTLQGYLGTRVWSPTLSANYGSLYFTEASTGTEVLWYATRSDRGAFFYAAQATHSLFATGSIGTPYISANGLSLYFYSTQVTGFGGGDLYLATRATTASNFSYPLAMNALNSTELDYLPWVSTDELTIVFVSQRSGASAYYTATRTNLVEGFGEPTLLASLTHIENNGRISISSDGLRAYFTSRNRPGGVGSDDVWYATRSSIDEDFANITNLTAVNSVGSETEVTVTQDGEELYFVLMGTNSNLLYRSLATCDG
jgi:hypothetical protein